jgi:hypothetical protein
MISFIKHSEPLVSLGVGQKQIISDWLDKMKVEDYIINDDYTIDVNRSVSFHLIDIGEFPSFINFNRVNGSFSFAHSKMITLRGCPKFVKNNFYCGGNMIFFTEENVRRVCNVKGKIFTFSYL